MSKENTRIREALEKIHGKKCMLHEGLKIKGYLKTKTNYTGKSIAMQLTLHHIKPKSQGGKASIENGAVVCRACHDFIEQTTPENRARINELLQRYKKCDVELSEDLKTGLEIEAAEVELTEKELKVKKIAYKRDKTELQKIRKEYEDR